VSLGVGVVAGVAGGVALFFRRRASRRKASAVTPAALALRPVVQTPVGRREAG